MVKKSFPDESETGKNIAQFCSPGRPFIFDEEYFEPTENLVGFP